jgi:hypothetical protein
MPSIKGYLDEVDANATALIDAYNGVEEDADEVEEEESED